MARPPLARMAWRNLWRHRRRTLITLSSISLGVMLAVIFTGIGDANFSEMIDLAARMGGGHVTIQNPEYLDTPTLSRTVREDGMREAALGDPDVVRVVTRITGQLMLQTAEQSYGAGFIAFDPRTEDAATLSILEALSEGEMLPGAGGNGIVLGSRLAENLGTGLGRKVVYTMTDKRGEIVQDVARVQGILHTGAPSIDGALCLLPIDRMRGVLGYEADEATLIAVFLGDQRRADAVAARLSKRLGDGVAALAWHAVQPDLAAFIFMKVASARFMEGIIALLVAAGIFNTLFVSVMERMREFGILNALGFGPGALFRLVVYESAWLALVGLAGAALLTAGPYYWLATTGLDVQKLMGIEGSEIAGVAMQEKMYIGIFRENLAIIVCAALLATLLAGLYPALRAARVEPVETIRLV